MAEKSDEWKKFEEEVAYWYRTLGYQVETNQDINGHQIDTCLKRTLPGGITVITQIDCKYSEGESIGINTITPCVNTFYNNRQMVGIQNLAIVTNTGFSKDASNIARNSNDSIKLITLDQLRMEVVDAKQYVERIIHDFEHYDEYLIDKKKPIIDLFRRTNLFKYYVALRCKDADGTIHEDIEQCIQSWLEDSSKNQLIILGDYGTGKSSLLQILTYEFAKSYYEDPVNCPIPIFVPLMQYRELKDLRKLILELCKETYGLNFSSPSAFDHLLDDGRLIILLDGFDEMESKSEEKIIFQNFNQIAGLAIGKSKIILSSRTHYFRKDSDIENLFNPQEDTGLLTLAREVGHFDIIGLMEFDDNQILEFLQRHTDEYLMYWQEIKNTYNLEDLSRRPILLEMIIRSLPSIIKSGKEINSAELYDTYTKIWIEREDWRARMTKDEKESFMEELACQMLVSQTYKVHHLALREQIKKRFSNEIESRSDEDIFDTDTRNCSFLNRDSDGNYQFIHKSFMEFFISKIIHKEILSVNLNIMRAIILPAEVLDFVSRMIVDKNKLYDIIFLTTGMKFDDVGYSGGNAISILNKMGETSFSSCNFSNTVLRAADFEDTVCEGCDFSFADLRGSNFINCSLIYSNMEGADLTDSKIGSIGYVTSIAFNRKENRIAYGTSNGYLIIFDSARVKRYILKRDGSCIKKVKFFNDDEYIGCIDEDTLRIWDSSYNKIFESETVTNGSAFVDFHPSKPSIVLLINNEICEYYWKDRTINTIHLRSGKSTLNINRIDFLIPIRSYDGYIVVTENRYVLFVNETGLIYKVTGSELRKWDEGSYDDDSGILILTQNSIKTAEGREYFGKKVVEYYLMKDYEVIAIKQNNHFCLTLQYPCCVSSNALVCFQPDDDQETKMVGFNTIYHICDVNSRKRLKSARNRNSDMRLGKRRSEGAYPAIQFFSKSNKILISDFSGNLVLWDWMEEEDLSIKEKRKYGLDSMLKVRHINTNLFKSDGMKTIGIIGLKEEDLDECDD